MSNSPVPSPREETKHNMKLVLGSDIRRVVLALPKSPGDSEEVLRRLKSLVVTSFGEQILEESSIRYVDTKTKAKTRINSSADIYAALASSKGSKFTRLYIEPIVQQKIIARAPDRKYGRGNLTLRLDDKLPPLPKLGPISDPHMEKVFQDFKDFVDDEAAMQALQRAVPVFAKLLEKGALVGESLDAVVKSEPKLANKSLTIRARSAFAVASAGLCTVIEPNQVGPVLLQVSTYVKYTSFHAIHAHVRLRVTV
ncbi:hypothetical protein AAMO2058_000958400 [Amorphochlora amoebiformis]